ncbi:ABC transporter permease [Herpetosiphon llansteffanensis]
MAKLRRWLGLAPASIIIIGLFGGSLGYGIAQSLGWLPFLGQRQLSLAAYRNVLAGEQLGSQWWQALLFSLWVSLAATLGSALICLGLLSSIAERQQQYRGLSTISNLHLAIPHSVWAMALLLVLSQSGIFARLGFALGWLDQPSDFPVLVRDRWGSGIVMAYITKEVPFLLLMGLASLRQQGREYLLVAQSLGANRWQRVRLVLWPLLAPSLIGGSLLVFSFIFGAYEVPALVGVRYPEMLATMALELFLNPDLQARAEGMAVSLLMSLIILAVIGLAWRWRRAEHQP